MGLGLERSRLAAVIFDCDGVLVDSEPLHYRAFQQVLAPLGLEHDYERYVDRYIGFDDRDAFIEVFRDAGLDLQKETLAALIAAKNNALLEVISKGVSSFPGVVQLVRELAFISLPLAVASGSLRTEIENFIEALELKNCFQIIVSADDVTHSKPDPETYLLALKRLQEGLSREHLNPRDCVAIEDTPAGIRSARDAGLYTIGVTHSFASDQLSDADCVLDDLTHLTARKLIELIEAINS